MLIPKVISKRSAVGAIQYLWEQAHKVVQSLDYEKSGVFQSHFFCIFGKNGHIDSKRPTHPVI
jgi:hypothetical protein